MKNNLLPYCMIAGIASLLFIPFLGQVHLFDWDEINFAEAAREMLATGNYGLVQINFEPFWEKPPLFIWLQALSMHLFGINEFAARFPNALCGIITLVVIFSIGKKIYGSRFALIWVMAFAGSFFPHFYFKTAIIDPWFNLFTFLGIFHAVIFFNNPVQNKPLVFSAFFIGLAVLTKGPVALLIFLLCTGVFWFFKKFKPVANSRQVLLFVLTFSVVGGSWFIYLFMSGNSNIVADFILYHIRLLSTEDAGHGGFFLYHFVVLLFGCFPASVFAIPSVLDVKKFILRKLNVVQGTPDETPFREFVLTWMRILFWTVLLLFSVVQTKIIHYSSLCYFPLTFLAAHSVEKILNGQRTWKKWQTFLAATVSLALGGIMVLAPLIEKYKARLLEAGVIPDAFAAENLKATVEWDGWEWLIGAAWLLMMWWWIFSFRKNFNFRFSAIIFLATGITTNALMVAVVPQIEQYTQKAAIDFFESKQTEDCSIETIGYKSYAQYFYARQKENTNHHYKIKTHYRVSKITGEEQVKKECPECKEIYRKNGFIFWEMLMK